MHNFKHTLDLQYFPDWF